jgi:HK97 family phage prohead protease
MKTKYFFADTKRINTEAKTIDVVASTPDLDRDGEVILPSAFARSIASFKANPVILVGHQHRLANGESPVIGAAIPETIKITDKDLSFTMRFAPTKNGNEHWTLYSEKFQNSFSVGFIPMKWEDRTIEGKSVRHYTDVELLEVSAVPVPSNASAVARAMSWYDSAEDDRPETIKSIQGPILAAIDEIKKSLSAFASLREEVTNLADELGEFKSLIAGSGGYGRGLLGGSPVADPHAGEKVSAEETLKVIQNALKLALK